MSSSKMDNTSSQSSKVSVKHDWYQTEQQVVIQILVKNIDGDKVKINFSKSELDIQFPLNDGSYFDNSWALAYEVVPERCFLKTTPTKVEIRLAKAEGKHWSELESKVLVQKKSFGRNWDEVVKEFKEDDQEGEAALNALFQKIYEEGSDEVKKAMNKSFLESGGTELNTNWDTVKKGKVTVKPPDGMEWKSWDQ